MTVFNKWRWVDQPGEQYIKTLKNLMKPREKLPQVSRVCHNETIEADFIYLGCQILKRWLFIIRINSIIEDRYQSFEDFFKWKPHR